MTERNAHDDERNTADLAAGGQILLPLMPRAPRRPLS